MRVSQSEAEIIRKMADEGVLPLGNIGTSMITILTEDGAKTEIPPGSVAEIEWAPNGRFRRVIRVYPRRWATR